MAPEPWLAARGIYTGIRRNAEWIAGGVRRPKAPRTVGVVTAAWTISGEEDGSAPP